MYQVQNMVDQNKKRIGLAWESKYYKGSVSCCTTGVSEEDLILFSGACLVQVEMEKMESWNGKLERKAEMES